MTDLFADLRTNPSFHVASIDDAEQISQDNRSFLQESIAYRPEFAMEILCLDVDINHQDDNFQTALQYAVSRGMYELAIAMIDREADINLIDRYGNDALWTAVLNPRPSLDLIALLIQKGADPHRKNKAGRSAADMAVTKNATAMQQLFGLQ